MIDESTQSICDVDNTWNFSYGVPTTILYYEWEKYLYVVLMPFMFVFAAISNILFLVVVARIHFMKTTTNFYLVNLAISDMFYILGTTGFFISRYLASPLRLDSSFIGGTGCHLIYLFGGIFFFTSMNLITLVSMDRYCAICHPLKHLKKKSKRRTVKIVIAGWSIGIISSIITTLAYLDHNVFCVIWPDSTDFVDYPSTIHICGFGDENKAPNLAIIIVNCVIWLVTSTCNCLFCIMLLLSVRKVDHTLPMAKSATTTRNKNQISLILVANGTILFICNSMYYISFIIVALGASGNQPLSPTQEVAWFWMIYFVTYVSSSAHSIIYSVASQLYRKAFVMTLTCSSAQIDAPTRRRRGYRDLNATSRL